MSRYKSGTRDEVMILAVDLAIRWEQSLMEGLSRDDPERVVCRNRIADFEQLAKTAGGKPPAAPTRFRRIKYDANKKDFVEMEHD